MVCVQVQLSVLIVILLSSLNIVDAWISDGGTGGTGGYGLRKIPNILIECKSGNHEDNKTCLNGQDPKISVDGQTPTPEELETRILWYHPDNEENLKLVREIEQNCSSFCQSKTCYYSMKVLEFICGSNSSADFTDTQEEFRKIKNAHFNYQLFPDDTICWGGPLLGTKYNPAKITQADTKLAGWYDDKDIYSAAVLWELELIFSDQCRSKQCSLSVTVKRYYNYSFILNWVSLK